MSGLYGAVASAVRCLIVLVVAVHLHTLPRAALAALLDLPMIAISAFEIFALGAPASPRHTRAPAAPESPSMPSSPAAFPASRTTPGSRAPPAQPSPGLFPDGPVKAPARNDSEFSLLSGSDGSSILESPTTENMRAIREQFAPLLHSDDEGGDDDDDDAAEADAEMDSDTAATTRLMRRRSIPNLQGAGRSGTVLPLTAEQVAHAAYVPPTLPTATGMPFCHPLRPAALPSAVRDRVSPTTPGGADMDVPSSSEDQSDATIPRRPMHRRRRTGGANELLPPGSPTTTNAGSASSGGSSGGGASAFPSTTASAAIRRPLVRPSGGKVLVLDLDDTLLCSALTASKYATPATYREVVPTGSGADLYHVWERPHVATFLQRVSQWYHLAVFTAAAKPYADVVVDRLERHIPSSGKRMLRRRFYRTDCTALRSGGGAPAATAGPGRAGAAPPAGSYWKDLNKVAPAALHSRMVLLDDTVECFAPQPSNGLVCPRYCPPRHTSLFSAFGAKPAKALTAPRKPEEDRALLDLLPVLEALSHTWDVRAVLSHQHHVSALRKRAHAS